jgi:uncharacterized protein (TIGR00288 family)
MKATNTVAAYFDIPNIWRATKDLNLFTQWLVEINEKLTRLGKVIIKNAFVPNSDKILYPIIDQKFGWNVQIGRFKKDIDSMLCVDCLTDGYDGKYTRAVIISGDADFIPVAEKLRTRGKEIYVICAPQTASSDLFTHYDGNCILAAQCEYCEGKKIIYETCRKCGGDGKYKTYYADEICWSCKGTGKFSKVCQSCGGTGSFGFCNFPVNNIIG